MTHRELDTIDETTYNDTIDNTIDEAATIDETVDTIQDNEPTPTPSREVSKELIKDLKEYLDHCKHIKQSTDELKILKERKAELEEHIVTYMKQNNVPTINTPSGNISFYEGKSTKSLNKELLKETISSRLADQNMAEEITKAAFENRPSNVVSKIRVKLRE